MIVNQKWIYIITSLSAIIVNVIITSVFEINFNIFQLILIDVFVCMLVGSVIKLLKK